MTYKLIGTISWEACSFHKEHPDKLIDAFGAKVNSGEPMQIGCPECYENAAKAFRKATGNDGSIQYKETFTMYFDKDINRYIMEDEK